MARLLALGACIVDDLRRPDGSGCVVRTDPKGRKGSECSRCDQDRTIFPYCRRAEKRSLRGRSVEWPGSPSRAAPFFGGCMDRCAVFVDAGYLYAEGGKLCCGTPSRTQSVLQPAPAVQLLVSVAGETTRLPVLRIDQGSLVPGSLVPGMPPRVTGFVRRSSARSLNWPMSSCVLVGLAATISRRVSTH